MNFEKALMIIKNNLYTSWELMTKTDINSDFFKIDIQCNIGDEFIDDEKYYQLILEGYSFYTGFSTQINVDYDKKDFAIEIATLIEAKNRGLLAFS